MGRSDRHVGPRAQTVALSEAAPVFGTYALDSISEFRKEGGWQLLVVLELEENMKMVRKPHGLYGPRPQERPTTFQTSLHSPKLHYRPSHKRETLLTWIFGMPQNSD